MARTTINSLGVPAGTITAADLTFPLTDFSSTGIDDNATSNALTIDSSQDVTFSSHALFPDNSRARFGAGLDLQIYHDGSNSYIDESSGVGNLIVKGANVLLQNTTGENYLTLTTNGAATLYYDNAAKLATTSTGIDVTGTATMGGLAVEGTYASPLATFNSTSGFSRITLQENGVARMYMQSLNGADGFKFMDGDGTSERMRIDASGNVILNQNAGAADNTILRITGGTAGFSTLHLADTADINIGFVQYDHTNNALTFASNNAERMRIDSSGNVGINEIAPDVRLHVKGGNSGATGNSAGQVFVEGNTSAGISIGSATTSSSYVWFGDSDNIAQGRIRYDNSADKFEFRANNVDDILVLGSVEAVFNEESNNQDFRVETDINTHALFVDASLNRIGLFESSPQQAVTFGGPNIFEFRTGSQAMFRPSTNDNDHRIVALSSAGMDVVWGGAVTTSMQKWQNGAAVTFNDDSNDQDFRIESNNNATMLVVDAGNDQVIVGTSTPITGVGAVMALGGGSDTRLAIDGSSSSGLYLTDSGAQGITIRNASGDLEFYGITTREFVFNQHSVDTDFRVESDTSTHALFVDATNGNIGINDSAPSSTLASGISATGRVLSIASGGTTAISIRSNDTVNDRNAVLEMLSSGNGGSDNIIVFGDTDTTPSSPSGLQIQGYHSGSRVQRWYMDSNGAIYWHKAGAGGGWLTAELAKTHVGSDSAGTADISFTITFTNTGGVYDNFQVMLYLSTSGNSFPAKTSVYEMRGQQRSSAVTVGRTSIVAGESRSITTSTSGLNLTITLAAEGGSTATQGAVCRVLGARYGVSKIVSGNS